MIEFHSGLVPSTMSPIARLNSALDFAIESARETIRNFLAVKTVFNDYDRNVDEMVSHFSDADGSVFLAKLENSNPEIITIKS